MALIQSGNGSDLLAVDTENKAARVALYGSDGSKLSKAHGDVRATADSLLPLAVLNDDNYRAVRGDRFGGIAIASTNMLFSEFFDQATISVPSRFTILTTTFTQSQSGPAGLNLNSASITTAGAAALFYTNRRFARFQRAPLQLKVRARLMHVPNATIEFGFGQPVSQTVSPTTGAFFQVTPSGVIQGVLTFNGVDQTTSPIVLPTGWQSSYYIFDIIMDDDEVKYIVQDTSTGLIIAERRIQSAVTAPRLWDVCRQAAFGRLHFPTAPVTPANLLVTILSITSVDTVTNKPWGHALAHLGYGSEQNPVTMAQNSNYANSAAPATGAASNTAAAYTTLGGQFQYAAIAGAETDLIVFGYTVPTPYSLIVTGIDISTYNMGAAVATSPTLLQWFVSPDQTAVSLATANNRRVTLGSQSLAVGTPIGGMANADVIRDFSNAPLVTNPARIFVIGLKMPVGAATASQIIRGTVAIKGYFE